MNGYSILCATCKKGIKSEFSRSASEVVRLALKKWVSSDTRPRPGKCLRVGMILYSNSFLL